MNLLVVRWRLTAQQAPVLGQPNEPGQYGDLAVEDPAARSHQPRRRVAARVTFRFLPC